MIYAKYDLASKKAEVKGNLAFSLEEKTKFRHEIWSLAIRHQSDQDSNSCVGRTYIRAAADCNISRLHQQRSQGDPSSPPVIRRRRWMSRFPQRLVVTGHRGEARRIPAAFL